MCRTLLETFYDSIIASALCYAVVCLGGGCTDRDRSKLDKFVGRSSAVVRSPLDPVETRGKRRMLTKLNSIIDNPVTPCMRSWVY